MSYRRNRLQGGTYFFTLCLQNRSLTLLTDYITELRQAYTKTQEQMPFYVDAMVVLPEHIHALWTLPQNDDDYANRIRIFKGYFSRQLPKSISQTNHTSRNKKGELGIWQRRYWEHTIRDENDYNNHMNYIHYNPVKHSLVTNVIDWEYSTFHREIKNGRYPHNWGSNLQISDFDDNGFGE